MEHIQAMYKLILDDNSAGIQHTGPFIDPPGFCLVTCNGLAALCTEEERIMLTQGASDERGAWLENNPHMFHLDNLMEAFFHQSWGDKSFVSYLSK